MNYILQGKKDKVYNRYYIYFDTKGVNMRREIIVMLILVISWLSAWFIVSSPGGAKRKPPPSGGKLQHFPLDKCV